MHSITEWRPARLRGIRDLTPDIRLFEIEPAGGFIPPAPGSHISVAVTIGGRPDARSYSVIGPCPEGLYRIAVKRLPDSRGGSVSMHGLAPGARLTIAGPRNHFPLAHGRPDYLLVAGGIGITPIIGMALALAEAGAPFRLLYAVRQRQDLAFAEELRERLGDRLELFVDEEGGRIDLAAALARLRPGGELYVCGPIGLLEASKRAWQESGRPVEGLRFETFGNSGRYATEPFTVRIPRLGREIMVARNQTMLEALEAAGVGMIFDCRRGECGLCTVRILAAEGPVDHRDVFFSDAQKAANTHLCTCVSRTAGGCLTIDTADRTA
ncbi:PDR/VanB family oxidoreductase [Methylobacterium nodulans]|uniref:Oxidoreductase FAD/NAD(P)-binding domain protein n=1 Tax=Methylobacterium nodulans (strain LMG 21967 / CNCM I-2342 / ORS 2060) TaxID=460265 RepID=B8IJ49_METNO|nr:PDR/VanB family oxidoreductase [Methylobacterium nodulans]ACL61844.1 oxidoreductase FAD/NAD(P)-binding domain protein [Methylobacterium nodulans ORS 2060]